MTWLKRVLVMALFGMLVSACTSEQPDESEDSYDPGAMRLLQGFTTLEIGRLRPPAKVFAEADVAFVGEIEKVAPARRGPDQQAVVVGIRIDEEWKGSLSRSDDDLVWIALNRPGGIEFSVWERHLSGIQLVVMGHELQSGDAITDGGPGVTVYDPGVEGYFRVHDDGRLESVFFDEQFAARGWSGADTLDGLRSTLSIR